MDALPGRRISQPPVYANTESVLIFMGGPVSKLLELRWGFPPPLEVCEDQKVAGA